MQTNQNHLPMVFLPHLGEDWLCYVSNGNVEFLAKAPGLSGAVRKFSADGTEFGFMDSEGKRFGHFRVLREAPWWECQGTICNLPKNCVGHDFVVHEGRLIVGGNGPDREALWHREPLDAGWTSVPLPDGISKQGKAVDALFVRGDELIAVDNLLLPKWILVYSLTDAFMQVQKICRLPSHTTYERVVRAAEGKDTYAILSAGVNHHLPSCHLSLLSRKTLREVALWSGVPQTTKDIVDEVQMGNLLEEDLSPLQEINECLAIWASRYSIGALEFGHMLRSVKDMAYVGNHLFLALGEAGLKVIDTTHIEQGKKAAKGRNRLQLFVEVTLRKLTTVASIQAATGNRSGIYAIGTDAAGDACFEWISI